MKFIDSNDGRHPDAVLKLLRVLKKEKNRTGTFWHNRGFILERFMDVVVVEKNNGHVTGFYITRQKDKIRIIEMIQSFRPHQGLGTDMICDMTERYANILLVEDPLPDALEFWKKIGLKQIDRSGRVSEIL